MIDEPCILHQKKEMEPRVPVINCLKSEVFIMLHCQLHVCTNQELFKSTSAIKVATMKITDDFHYKGKPSCATAKLTPFAVSKDE